MSKIVTIMNMKGGVGKTTLTMHLAGMIASHRFSGFEKYKRILMIDYDPQFNLSQSFIDAPTYFRLEKERKTTLAILTDDDADLNPYELQVPGNHTPPKVNQIAYRLNSFNDGGYFDIVPATLDLMYLALGQTTAQIKPIEERFDKFIADCRTQYDLVFIDCHPAGSLFTKTSLRNSDHVIIPVVPQKYSFRGIGLMMRFIDAKRQGSKGPTPHILFNQTGGGKMSKDEISVRTNTSYSKYCMANSLNKFGAFGEPEGGAGFVWESKKPYSRTAKNNLTKVVAEVLNRIEI